MDDQKPGGFVAAIASIINSFKYALPYLIVLYAIHAAIHGAPDKVWTPILIAGAALIDPHPNKGSGSE